MEENLWTYRFIRAVIALSGVYLISNTLISVLAIFAKQLSGLDTSAGLMISLFTLGSVSVRFLTGKITRIFGTKIVVTGGILLIMVGSTLFILSNSINFAMFSRIIQGVGFGIATTALTTSIANICPSSRLLEGIGYMSIALSITSVIGPAIGFYIIGKNYSRFNALFIFTLIVALVVLIMLLLEKKPAKPPRQNMLNNQNLNLLSSNIHYGLLVVPTLIIFFNSLSQSAVVSFLALYAINKSMTGIGMYFSINSIGMILSRFLVRYLARPNNTFLLIRIFTLIYGLSLLGIIAANTTGMLYLLALPTGFAIGATGPLLNTYMLQTVPDHKKSMANAIFYSTLDIGYGIGSIGWGFFAKNLGYDLIFPVAAILQIFVLIFTFIQRRNEYSGVS